MISSRLKLEIPLFSTSRLCSCFPIDSIIFSMILYSRCFLFRFSNDDNGSYFDAVIVRLSAVLCDNIDLGNAQLRMSCSDEK